MATEEIWVFGFGREPMAFQWPCGMWRASARVGWPPRCRFGEFMRSKKGRVPGLVACDGQSGSFEAWLEMRG